MKKSVLFLAEELRVGGAETYFYKIENNIDRKNIDFYTAAVNGGGYNNIKFKNNYYELNKKVFSKILKINKIINSKDIDVVHANSLRLCMVAALIKKITHRKFKVFYTKHNLTFLEKINDKLFAKFVNKNVDKLITVCNYDKKIMTEKGIIKEKIYPIPNGTDIDQFKFNSKYLQEDKNFNIGILARLSEEKNHSFFIDIVDKLSSKTQIKFNAFMAGDGPLRQQIHNEINKRKLNITMLGNVSDPQNFLKDIDVLLLVSKREVFPMTILEAMCVGSLVVSIDVGGVRDSIYNGETGYLIDKYDCDKFSEVIEQIYQNREENKKIIYKARSFVEDRFSMKSMINGISELYVEG